MNLNNSNCDKNSRTQIVMKQQKTQIVMKLKNSNSNKTKKLT